MSTQSTSLQTVPQLPAESAHELVPAANSTVEIAIPLQKPAKKDRIRRALLAGAAAALLATASWYGWDYWTVGRFLVSTDDAYVKADNTTIAPKVSGYLNQVLVGDNQHVKAGQVLARIDDRDFKVALDQARADVAAAQAVSRKQARATRRAAGHDRFGQGDVGCRHRSTGFHRAGEQALHRSRRDRLWQRTECAERASTRYQCVGRHRARQGKSCVGAKTGRTAEGRARTSRRGCREGQCAGTAGRAQSFLYYHHRADRRRGRKSHVAQSVSSCRPAHS